MTSKLSSHVLSHGTKNSDFGPKIEISHNTQQRRGPSKTTLETLPSSIIFIFPVSPDPTQNECTSAQASRTNREQFGFRSYGDTDCTGDINQLLPPPQAIMATHDNKVLATIVSLVIFVLTVLAAPGTYSAARPIYQTLLSRDDGSDGEGGLGAACGYGCIIGVVAGIIGLTSIILIFLCVWSSRKRSS
ncbi:hypothetical protein F5Y19DRAFT_471040 [Xylariaceae sp. FL1651]|nr:hypothetical protein F5Y19DRAFT_471040 [Xylariaceae sp. FL1651]